VDTALARYIRRVTGDPTYLTYWHKIEGCWVIAQWVNEIAGWVCERNVCPTMTGIGMVPRSAIDQLHYQNSWHAREFLMSRASHHREQEYQANVEAQEKADLHLGIKRFLQKKASTYVREDDPGWAGF